MPRGNGHRFSIEEDKFAKRIAKNYRKKGYSMEEAKRIGYATVQKLINADRKKHITRRMRYVRVLDKEFRV